MKKLIHSIFLLISFSSSSQSYIPFPDSNAWWIAHAVHAWLPPNKFQYFISGDTLINSSLYHRVDIIDTASQTVQYEAAFRQDTAARKVFIKPPLLPEYLAYDFSLSIGDTFELDSFYMEIFTVSIVDSLLVQGQYRKHLHLVPVYPFCLCMCEPDWIEGIGSLYGFYPKLCSELDYFQLDCFSVNNLRVYPDTGNCDFILSLFDPPGQNRFFSVSPNPFSEGITIRPKGQYPKNVTLTVRSLAGTALYTDNLLSISMVLDKKIDLGFLASGVYLLEITDDHGPTIIKLVKE